MALIGASRTPVPQGPTKRTHYPVILIPKCFCKYPTSPLAATSLGARSSLLPSDHNLDVCISVIRLGSIPSDRQPSHYSCLDRSAISAQNVRFPRKQIEAGAVYGGPNIQHVPKREN